METMLSLAGGLLSPWLAEFHLEHFTRGESSALTMKGSFLPHLHISIYYLLFLSSLPSL